MKSMINALGRMAPRQARRQLSKLVKIGLLGRKDAGMLFRLAMREAQAERRRITAFAVQEARREYARAKPVAARLARRGARAGLKVASRLARRALRAGRKYGGKAAKRGVRAVRKGRKLVRRVRKR